MYDAIVYPFLIGLTLASIFTPLTIILAKKYNFIDDPKTHKHPAIIHTKPVPRAGGLPIFASILFGSIFLMLHFQMTVVMIIFAGFIVTIVGLLDDKYDLSPYLRFSLNILSACIVVFAGISLPFITNPLGEGILFFDHIRFSIPLVGTLSLSHILAIIWIVWVMNMLNWSKGVDGQMPGIAAIAAIFIGIASLRFANLEEINITTAMLSFLVAGSACGFLIYNFYPAKIFPGYSATILGFLIGVLSIMSSVKLATAILVMGVPMVDAMFTIIRRISSKKSPFWHDKGHLHHLLLKSGFSQRKIAISYWVVSLILGLAALQLSSRGKLFTIILITILVSAIIGTLQLILKKVKNYD